VTTFSDNHTESLALTLRHFNKKIHYIDGISKPETAEVNQTLIKEVTIILFKNEPQVCQELFHKVLYI